MAWEIQKIGCKFIATSTVETPSGSGNFIVHEFNACDVTAKKKYTNSTEYTFYNNLKDIEGMCGVPIADILSADGSFTDGDQATFETWAANELCCDSGSGGGGFDDTNILIGLTSVETEVSANGTKLDDVNSELDNIETHTSNTADATQNIEGTVGDIDSKLVTTNSELSDVNTGLDNIESTLNSIETINTGIGSDVSDVSNNTADTVTNTANINTNVVASNVLLTSIQSDTSQLNTTLNSVETSNDNIADNTANIEGEMVTANSTLTNIETNTSPNNSNNGTLEINAGTAVALPANVRGFTATLLLPPPNSPSSIDYANDYGEINGIEVPIGYSVSAESLSNNSELANSTDFEAFGNAKWIVYYV